MENKNKVTPEEQMGLSHDITERLRVGFEKYIKGAAKNINPEHLLARKALNGDYKSLYTRYAWASWLYCFAEYNMTTVAANDDSFN